MENKQFRPFSHASKREEFATYRALDLKRTAKSRKKRRFVDNRKIFRFIGGDSPERPYLKVLHSEYEKVWAEVARDVRLGAYREGISYEALDDLTRGKVAREVYARLAAHAEQIDAIEKSFYEREGRGMTPHEMELYTELLEKEPGKKPVKNLQKNAHMMRKHWINEVLRKVEVHHVHGSGRLQQAWASVVGEEIAQDTVLEDVVESKGLAICRCLSSVRSFELKRRRDLPQKLSAELGLNIKRVIFR